LSLSKKNFRLVGVPKPVGQKGCTFHHGFSVAIYSPSKNATASICHGSGFRKAFESRK
jgi:hypothetical protein